MKEKKVPRHAKKNSARPWEKVQIAVFALTLTGMTVLGLILPLRPTESAVENRKLAQFPDFSWDALISGEYFKGISKWYADTFPLRDAWVEANSKWESAYGLPQEDDVKIHGDVEQGDAIPDVPDETPPSLILPTTPAPPAPSTQTTPATTAPATQTTPSTTAPSTQTTPSTTAPSTQITQPTAGVGGQNVISQSFDAVLQVGDAAFEYYNFKLAVADRYAEMLNYTAQKWQGKANVYTIVVPNSMGIMLPDELRGKVNSDDQGKAIRYIFSKTNENVFDVPIYDTLMSHRDEYLYFRTDHHWTQRGAYYAYATLMQIKGRPITPLESYKTVTYDNFLGTFYANTNQSPALGKNPDYIEAFLPQSTNRLTYYYYSKDKLKPNNWDVVHDVSSRKPSGKYSCFIGGDNPLTVITNPQKKDGSACVVIKDSYGNAFVPFLVDEYEHVYVIDPRYYKPTLEEFMKQYPVQDIIFVNNISATRSTPQVGYMEKLVGKK